VKSGSNPHQYRSAVSCGAMIVLCLCWTFPAAGIQSESEPLDYHAFQQALDSRDDTLVASVGESLFNELRRKYNADPNFLAFVSKLTAAEFLANQMQSQLATATESRIRAVAEMSEEEPKTNKRSSLLVAPARQFYDSAKETFSKIIRTEGLAEDERSFLAEYYNFKLRVFASAIAQTGQALAVAEPDFKDTYDYVLVLPLLHASEKYPIKLSILPKWMQKAEQLPNFSDSCLLHFDNPFQAMTIEKAIRQEQGKPFSELEFYKSAAKKCGTGKVNVAVDCLKRAMKSVSADDPDAVLGLELDVLQLWRDSGNYTLAAGQAKNIFESYPDRSEYAKAKMLYYHALAVDKADDTILTDIDETIRDDRCRRYKPQLIYLKWVALRRKQDQQARLAAVENELLKEYGHDPIVAPIMLARATDRLADQDYAGAREVLANLVETFPSTEAATAAKRILDKLKTVEK
jgi:hypothetical protein